MSAPPLRFYVTIRGADEKPRPWPCGCCGNYNEPDAEKCAYCGLRRRPL